MIFEARIKKKILQCELAKQLNMTGQFLGRIEKGEVWLPVDRFKLVSKILGIPVTKLIDWQVAKFKNGLTKEVSNG